MNTVVGVLGTILITLILSVGMSNVKDYDNIDISGEEILEIPSSDIVNEDIININNFYRIETEEYAVIADEVDLISEYNFLKKIADQNDLDVSRQLKNYVPEHIAQKYEEYSDFQQNIIIFNFKDDRDFYIEIEFSENEILDTWKENSNKTFLDSTIENETVHIFEWKIPDSDYENNCRAQFTVNGMNFVIKIINASHEESMKIIKTTIKEYKNFEKEKKESGYIKIKDANLYSEGTSLRELVKYDDKLYGRAFSEIDYGGNPNGSIGVIDRLIAREYIPIYNGETNTARFLNAKVDSVTERRLILLAEEGAVPFERVYVQELENNEIFERKMPDELEISRIKACNEQLICLLTQDKSSYIYDYKEDTYKLVLADENIEHINFLNVLKNKNKIYLEVQYKNGKFSLLGINYLDGTFSEIELTISGTDIKVSEDEKKITYRKDSSSLYVSNIDGSNENLLLKSINKGEHPDTTGYVPAGFIENNKVLYTCIGYEHTKGLRNYKF